MRGSFKLSAQLVTLAIGLMAASCLAAGNVMPPTTDEDGKDQSWSREQQRAATKLDAKTIVQQKAQIRAEQRQDRIATMSWYGMSNSRPTAATTPFTSRYSSTWEMPGGRPNSWTPTWSRPNYVFPFPYGPYGY